VKLFARHQLAGVFEETDQHLNRLPFKPDFSTLPLKLARAQIKLENPESDPTRGWYHWFHCI
jgi:hypothetical protein